MLDEERFWRHIDSDYSRGAIIKFIVEKENLDFFACALNCDIVSVKVTLKGTKKEVKLY